MPDLLPTEVTLGLMPCTDTDIAAIAKGARVHLAPEALAAMQATQSRIQDAIRSGQRIYGLTTGVGDLHSVALSETESRDMQLSMLRSHASGVGAPLEVDETRAIMAVTLRAILQGASGVSPDLAKTLAEMLNRNVTPWAPVGGSVGYLIATAHIGLSVFGHGRSWFEGNLLDGRTALERAGIEVRVPGPREGHALIGGTYEIGGLAALAIGKATRLLEVADIAAALSLEALRGNTRGYDARVQALRPHPGQIATAARMRALLDGSDILAASRDLRLQDALSLRCVPQVHGAVRDCLDYCDRVLATELNSVTDNPAFVVEDDALIALPNGNGHGAPLALALDYLTVAMASVATMAHARCERLGAKHLSGLPAFLVGGGASGFSISSCVSAAMSAEARALAAPASVFTTPTVASQEDHLSMGVAAARKLLRSLDHLTDLLCVECLMAAQGIDHHAPMTPGRGTAAVLAAIRQAVSYRDTDREMQPDMSAMRQLIDSGTVARAVRAALDHCPCPA